MPMSPHYDRAVDIPAIADAVAVLLNAARDYGGVDPRAEAVLKLAALEYAVRVLLDLKLLDGGAFRQQLLEVAGDVLRVARERPGSLP